MLRDLLAEHALQDLVVDLLPGLEDQAHLAAADDDLPARLDLALDAAARGLVVGRPRLEVVVDRGDGAAPVDDVFDPLLVVDQAHQADYDLLAVAAVRIAEAKAPEVGRVLDAAQAPRLDDGRGIEALVAVEFLVQVGQFGEGVVAPDEAVLVDARDQIVIAREALGDARLQPLELTRNERPRPLEPGRFDCAPLIVLVVHVVAHHLDRFLRPPLGRHAQAIILTCSHSRLRYNAHKRRWYP